jgi:hypothetical protein
MLGKLQPGDVRPMVSNAAGVTWAPRCAALLDFFDAAYSHVLRLLEETFNGQGNVGPPVGMMWAVINALAAYVVEIPYQAAGADAPREQALTPRYRYTSATPEEAYASLGADDVESEAVQAVAKALRLTSGS